MNKFIITSQQVKGYKYGNRLELGTNIGNPRPNIKLSKDEYVTADGEIREFIHKSENRSENINSLRKTMKRLGRLIEHNFCGDSNELWITLTYAENVRDSKKVYDDYKLFMRKLRRRYGTMEYISILEPQKRGAWHIHALLKSEEHVNIFIPNSELSNIWGNGFVNVKKMRQTDNIAAYVTAYLTDLKHDEDDDVRGKDVDNKKIEKGARLYLYPAGMNFYRYSRGIKKPDEVTASKKEIFEFYNIKNSVYLPDNYYSYDIELPDGNIMTYQREFYNLDYWKGNDEE